MQYRNAKKICKNKRKEVRREMDIKEKESLIQSIVEYLEAEVESSRKSIEVERKAMNNAPTARESWSDTTRSQKEGLLVGLGKGHSERLRALAAFRQISVRVNDRVQVGALLELEENGESSLCMLVPGLTMTLGFQDRTIEVVSVASPIARALLGHRARETVEVEVPKGMRSFKILSIS